MRASDRADVWVLLGPHKGDNDQVLALADALALPYRVIQMRYRWFGHLPAVLRAATIGQLLPQARREIVPPWPRLVLGIGQRSAPVARYIKRASGGLTKTVRLGEPMVSHRLFDLVITTSQYAVRDASNVVRLPITLTNRSRVEPNELEQQWLERFPRPRRLLVIGGRTSLWRMDPKTVRDSALILRRRASEQGGSVLAVTSPRTDPALAQAAEDAIGREAVVSNHFPRYCALLASCDEIHVTGDSVSMLSDAVATGKPVGLIPLRPNLTAKALRLAEAIRGEPFRLRDLSRFWNELRSRGLVGTIDHPIAGSLVRAPADTAVAAVTALLQEQPATLRIWSPPEAAPQAAAEPLPL
jgi:mitochondrial fission protein ELM1